MGWAAWRFVSALATCCRKHAPKGAGFEVSGQVRAYSDPSDQGKWRLFKSSKNNFGQQRRNEHWKDVEPTS